MERNPHRDVLLRRRRRRMWLEETLGQRINQNRVNEAARTLGGKGTVATQLARSA